MNIITVTKDNLASEHICCAIANNNDCQVASKKSWMAQQFDSGLVFKKGDVRGKCFIEYMPAENAWLPIDAPGYMVINCLWVSGQYKGQGHSTLLLNACVEDSKAKGKLGLAVVSSKKKLPFLADPKYLRYKGFALADSALPQFELLYLPFEAGAPAPRFKERVKAPHIDEPGYVLYYTQQCPYTAKYVPVAEALAASAGAPFKAIHFETAKQAQDAPAAVTTYCLFKDGQFLTNEIQSPQKLEKLFSA